MYGFSFQVKNHRQVIKTAEKKTSFLTRLLVQTVNKPPVLMAGRDGGA